MGMVAASTMGGAAATTGMSTATTTTMVAPLQLLLQLLQAESMTSDWGQTAVNDAVCKQHWLKTTGAPLLASKSSVIYSSDSHNLRQKKEECLQSVVVQGTLHPSHVDLYLS